MADSGDPPTLYEWAGGREAFADRTQIGVPSFRFSRTSSPDTRPDRLNASVTPAPPLDTNRRLATRSDEKPGADISETKNQMLLLRRQATYDALTDLPNRTLLLETLEKAIDPALHILQLEAVDPDGGAGLLSPPRVLLREQALRHNISAMAAYCAAKAG